MFVRNAWYVAAWDHEVTRTLKRRVILDEPVLLFRKDDGTAVALKTAAAIGRRRCRWAS